MIGKLVLYGLPSGQCEDQNRFINLRPPPMRQARLHPLRATQSRLRGANGDEVAPW
jgi:hypothetical protein